MIQHVEKKPKVTLCRVCNGTGTVLKTAETPARFLRKRRVEVSEETCPQCEGSGRVTVSAKMEMDIRPYKPEK